MRSTKGKSSFVTIDGHLVTKKFRPVQKKGKRGPSHHCFMRELECLQRLHAYPHFPGLVSYDMDNLSITMSYCGELYPEGSQPRPDLLPQVDSIVNIIHDTGIKFCCDQSFFPYNDIHILGDVIKVIDFENTIIQDSLLTKMYDSEFVDWIETSFDLESFKQGLTNLLGDKK